MSKRPNLRAEVAGLCAAWYREKGRHYPWRESGDPYRILVAECLLRKTQVGRVLPVYTDFVSRYPTMADLAEADPAQVRDMVAPLGLPERGPEIVAIARSLMECGATIESGEGLLRFKGVGRYIANAVECLSFGRVAPLVDGAVGRLLRRAFGRTPDQPAYADKTLWDLAQSVLEARSQDCRDVVLGMIDVSSEFCKPRNPLCHECPLASVCRQHKRRVSVRPMHTRGIG